MKTKIKSYGDEATGFHDKETPKAGSDCTCLTVIVTDSTLEKEENYCPQVFLKECKYIEEEERYIIEPKYFFSNNCDEEIFSNDSDEE